MLLKFSMSSDFWRIFQFYLKKDHVFKNFICNIISAEQNWYWSCSIGLEVLVLIVQDQDQDQDCP